MSSAYWLTNTRLETSYQMNEGIVTGTNSESFHLLIKDKKIAKIIASTEKITDDLPKKDAHQLLALPSFVEKHCHLDKTMLGDRWRPVTPARNIFERLDIEKQVLPSLKTATQERAELLLDKYVEYGVTHVRTHVDIYPEIGLTNVENVQKALRTFEGKLTSEMVAFPQHGLLRTNSKQLIREALKNGAGFVGGVDPATVDGDINASLHAMVDLAVEGNAGIDLHLHDPDHLGIFTIKKLARLTIEAGLQGKVAISHAFGLGDIPLSQAEEMADLLAEAGITIISSVPINRKFPPMGLLRRHGVAVAVGCDNIFDVWSPFGNGDILQRVGRLAEISHWVDELSLSQSLYYITGGKTPLDQEGRQVWPKIGDEANLVFVEASCSAEAVARNAKRAATIFNGEMTSGSLQSY